MSSSRAVSAVGLATAVAVLAGSAAVTAGTWLDGRSHIQGPMQE